MEEIHDNSVMMEAATADAVLSSANRIVSPSPPLLEGCSSFDQWQPGHEWDDVVLLAGPQEDEDETMDDVLLDLTENKESSLLDSALMDVTSNTVPSIDEFLVDQPDDELSLPEEEKEEVLAEFEPPSSKKDATKPKAKPKPQPKPTSDIPKKKRPLPTPNYPFEDQYTQRLCRLKDSMRRSRQSRQSLCVSSPQTHQYSRRQSISQILHQIARSSHQIDNCYLDPDYLMQQTTSA